jgi:glucokinase
MRILAGDIGGTNVRLRIAEVDDGGIRTMATARFESARFTTFAQLLHEFLAMPEVVAAALPDAACLAVAGPIRQTSSGQMVQVTNLPWVVDSTPLARDFGFARLQLINDFQAVGYGIEALKADELVVLQHGEPEPHGVRAVLGAGTGLGQAILVWQGDRYTVLPTEGGHADFGPVDELQIELARHLLRQHGHASYELILSGPGLVRLYAFLRARRSAPESAAVAQAMQAGDPAAAITQAALQHGDALAQQALDLFVRIYGAQAGNLALAAGATGGIDIAGGIAPKIISAFGENFLNAFRNKGLMTSYLRGIPVRVILNAEVGLFGAMQVAARLPAQ